MHPQPTLLPPTTWLPEPILTDGVATRQIAGDYVARIVETAAGAAA